MNPDIYKILSLISGSALTLILVKYLLNKKANDKKASADATKAEGEAGQVNINNVNSIMDLVSKQTAYLTERNKQLLNTNITLNGTIEKMIKDYEIKMKLIKDSFTNLQKKVAEQSETIDIIRKTSRHFCSKENCLEREPPGGINIDDYIKLHKRT